MSHPTLFMANRTYAQKAAAMEHYAENRQIQYGAQFTEKQEEARVRHINEVMANFEDGSGNLTEKECYALINRLFPARKKIHPDRQ